MSTCIFCKIIAGEIPSYKVYEDENVLAFLDITPVNAGHTLVVPKTHYENLLDLPEDLAQKLIAVIKKIAPAILKGASAEGFNLGLNNGSVAGQLVPHFHWHIMPRFANDNFELWRGRKYEAGEAEEVLMKIKENLSPHLPTRY